MSLGRGARSITVGGVTYRWMLSRTAGGRLRAIVQHAGGRGARLRIDGPPPGLPAGRGASIAFGPAEIQRAIDVALGDGWRPGTPGPDRRVDLPGPAVDAHGAWPEPHDVPVRRLGRLALVPVVELEPCLYSRAPAPGTDGYWAACLADAGLELEPLTPGGWLVPVERLFAAAVLRRVVAAQCAETIEAWRVQDVPRRARLLPGGVALIGDDDLLLAPGCCSAIDSIRHWEAIVAPGEPGWRFIDAGDETGVEAWSGPGDPDVRVRLTERGYARRDEVRLVVRAATFSAALARALSQLDRLAAALIPILEESLPLGPAAELACCLAGRA